jgi:hypothetical protein
MSSFVCTPRAQDAARREVVQHIVQASRIKTFADSIVRHPDGGGFAVGSSWYPHYDPAALVELSVEKGKPIIGVTIK